MATSGHESEVITVGGLKSSLQDLNDGQQKCVTLQSIPTDTTLTFSVTDPVTSQPVTKYFKVGDRVVVRDTENGDEEYDYLVVYTLLKLYKEGNVDKAMWALGGSGSGGGGALGKIRVSLEEYVNSAKRDGTGLGTLQVSLRNTTDGVDITPISSVNGATVVFTKLTPLKDYKITVAANASYVTKYGDTTTREHTITNLAIGADESVTFGYYADEYTVSVVSNQGAGDTTPSTATLTYNSTAYGNGDKIKVPVGTTMSPTASDMSNVTDYSKNIAVSGKTITLTYSTTLVTVAVVSNQTGFNEHLTFTLAGKSRVVNANGTTEVENSNYVKVATGTAITLTQPDVTHYAKAATVGGNAFVSGTTTAAGTAEKILVTYSSTIVGVNMVGETAGVEGAAPSGAQATVSYSGGTDQTITNSQTALVPTGTAFTVTYAAVTNYSTPATYSATAAGTSMTATKAKYVFGQIKLTVSMSDSDATALASVAPKISVNGGTATNMTGSSGVFTKSLNVGDTYSITFNSLVGVGYQSPNTISGTFAGGVESKSATYQTTIYTLSTIQTTKNGSVQGSNPSGVGATLTYTGQVSAATLSAVNDTAKCPSNLTPTITPNTVYGYAGSASESNASIALTYATIAYALTVATNQSAHTDIASTVIRVSATGISANGYIDYTGSRNATEVLVPSGVTPTAASQSGVPSANTYAENITVDSTNHTITAMYSTEVLTVSITKDSGDGDLSTCSIAVTNGQTSLGTLTSASPTMKIAYGINYTLTPSSLEGYNALAAVTKNWADTPTKSLTFQYEEIKMITGYIILDQTSSDPTTKVIDESGNTYSNYQRPAVITAIRNASHCYVGTFANNKMSLKQLDDTDGTKYADGTSAATDITSTGKDVFMRLPFFFTRVSTYATNKIKVEFAFDPNQTVTTTAQPDGNGWKQWGGNDLIGKYEAYEANSKTYSQSGKDSTGSVSQADFKTHVRARGTGFTLVKWRHQNLMAILFYAYYGHTNCQSLIGSGANSNNKQTGLKNSLGMTDTTASNGNTDNIVFWGLENWWGNKYEWVDNVVVNSGTWTITEDDGSTRTLKAGTHVMTAAGSWIYPSKFYLGDNLDTVGAVGQTGGSDSTGYCDGQYIANQSSRVVARSCSYAFAFGGVAFVIANLDSSVTGTYIGSRLAFIGAIEIA